jgi:hypothetical protein
VQRYRVHVEGLPGARLSGREEVEVGPAQARWLPLAVQLPASVWQTLPAGPHPVRFRIERIPLQADQASAQVVENSTFIVVR